MYQGKVCLLCALVLSLVVMANAECIDEEHMYECHAPDEEAEDLTCTACYPDGDNGHYNCSCWVSAQQPPSLEVAYLTCQDALDKGQTKSGVYTLKPDHLPAFQVYCDMETDGGGWTVFQRTMDGSVEFNLNWTHYVHGFGNTSGEYWLGLSKIHRLANSSAPQELHVDLEDFSGNTVYAHYASFYIGGSSTDYTLHVSGYNGTAGDSLAYHHGSKFSTKDHGSDGGSCALTWKGGWWYKSCYYSKLNGKYIVGDVRDLEGIVWYHWKDEYYSCKYADMKIRD